MSQLGAAHFLSLPRPDIFIGPPVGVPDTTTLAAHDFDVDTRTGFMPPQMPLRRLSADWEQWELTLEDAISSRLQLGDRSFIEEVDKEKSRSWRDRVRELPILSIEGLKSSETTLRRAHLVLAWIMHFYVHSLPVSEPVRIPPSITLPLLQVSAQLQLPPVLTYSDDVLYNWFLESSQVDELPTETTIKCQTSFTSTNDEAEFYLTSARMELAGVDALELMRSTMDEAFVGDDIAIRRITDYLCQLVDVIHRLRAMLLDVKKGCDPQVFYHDVRPWFRGEDSQSGRKWVFEGIEQDPTLAEPTELSGPSAGQSSLIHALDIFLGVDQYSHERSLTGHTVDEAQATTAAQKSAFLERMQLYMPRHHRTFLNHLSNNPRPLRALVFDAATSPESSKGGTSVLEAYNAAVMALKEFRDAHMIIVALYIIAPARLYEAEVKSRSSVTQPPTRPGSESEYVTEKHSDNEPLKGTGGTDLVRFLKGVRDQTKGALMTL
ncbi:Indoleamine 2,3-dioxygenase [Psilocybe cubensis]|uniref:Indoleamine 2,3-dioxygenase n=2 Tax=Psilocybe cubensis TaxID=181762 RepID=A0A8H7XXM6_PSICU|nr:Indoleamine 2,3-dioxygenase [Psilocybe cubensis]KAH9481074.1 Indoleamine 2,3-dioxygenase [Psilocybe cubensis]